MKKPRMMIVNNFYTGLYKDYQAWLVMYMVKHYYPGMMMNGFITGPSIDRFY